MKILTELKLKSSNDDGSESINARNKSITDDVAQSEANSAAPLDDDAAEAAFQAERNSVDTPSDPQANPETIARDNIIAAESKRKNTPTPFEARKPTFKSKKQLAEDEVEAAEKAEHEAKKVKDEKDRALEKTQNTLDQEGGWMKFLSGIIGMVAKLKDWKPLNTLSNLQTFYQNRFRAEEDKKEYLPNFVDKVDEAASMASDRLKKAKKELETIEKSEKEARKREGYAANSAAPKSTPKPASAAPDIGTGTGAALEAGSGTTPQPLAPKAKEPLAPKAKAAPQAAAAPSPAPQAPTPSAAAPAPASPGPRTSAPPRLVDQTSSVKVHAHDDILPSPPPPAKIKGVAASALQKGAVPKSEEASKPEVPNPDATGGKAPGK